MVPRLQEKYRKEVAPTLQTEFSHPNPMSVAKLRSIVISMGMGSAIKDEARLDQAAKELAVIAGQKPVVCLARKSVSNFKLREGMKIGLKVTLRGARMYDFLDKLFNVALARVRDFSGVSPESFDGRGNYNLGLREQLIFPEISYDQIDRVRGMDVAIVTSARTDDEGRRLLQLMGMPFRSEDAAQRRAS